MKSINTVIEFGSADVALPLAPIQWRLIVPLINRVRRTGITTSNYNGVKPLLKAGLVFIYFPQQREINDLINEGAARGN